MFENSLKHFEQLLGGSYIYQFYLSSVKFYVIHSAEIYRNYKIRCKMKCFRDNDMPTTLKMWRSLYFLWLPIIFLILHVTNQPSLTAFLQVKNFPTYNLSPGIPFQIHNHLANSVIRSASTNDRYLWYFL